jgi:hypothetical protein
MPDYKSLPLSRVEHDSKNNAGTGAAEKSAAVSEKKEGKS